MVFHNERELKNYILSCSDFAIKAAQEKVMMIINHFLTEFYREFTPEVYDRTEQLLRSLTKSNIKSTGNGWVAEVYFDLSALDYSINRVNSSQTYWSEEEVLENAMVGKYPHGGYTKATGNTQIWTESMKVLTKERIEILKKSLIEAGIPVK